MKNKEQATGGVTDCYEDRDGNLYVQNEELGLSYHGSHMPMAIGVATSVNNQTRFFIRDENDEDGDFMIEFIDFLLETADLGCKQYMAKPTVSKLFCELKIMQDEALEMRKFKLAALYTKAIAQMTAYSQCLCCLSFNGSNVRLLKALHTN